MERAAFLARIAEAVAEAPDPGLPGGFPPTPASVDERPLAERFVAQLATSNGIARVIERAALQEAILDFIRELGSSRRIVATADTEDYRTEIGGAAAEARAELRRPDGPAWRDEASAADLGITSAVLGVASTGGVLIAPSPGSPRAASILPKAQLVILPVQNLVGGLEEAMAKVEELVGRSSAPFIVTGPSRTTDIEMTTVYGVHGPGVFRVLLLAEP